MTNPVWIVMHSFFFRYVMFYCILYALMAHTITRHYSCGV